MVIEKKIVLTESFYYPAKAAMDLDLGQEKAVENFNNEVSNGKMEFNEVRCLCGGGIFYQIADIDRYGLRQSTAICDNCGLIMSNPRMTNGAYREFYESDDYRKLYDGKDYLKKYEAFYGEGRGRPIFNSVVKHKPAAEIGRLLEFGCGGGWNLIPFIESGIKVKGYDYSHELTALGRKKGMDLEQGSLDDTKGTYDVIIVSHVIEHFTEFFNDIRKLMSHLNREGILYIAVPNILEFSMGQLQNAHIYYFSPKTFRYYLDRCGLKMISFQKEPGGHMSGIFIKSEPELDDRYLKSHFKETIRSLRFRAMINKLPGKKIIKKLIQGFKRSG